MKLKIRVKIITEGCMPVINPKGDWIDLRAAKDITVKVPQAGVQYQQDNQKYRDVTTDVTYIPLGIAMQLPRGFEAIVVSRSSTPSKFGIMCAISFGVIDNSYCGNEDEWKFPAIAIKAGVISKGDRICQFRIQLSQKANFWQKLKWMFSSGVKLIEVKDLSNENRGGFGSSGTN